MSSLDLPACDLWLQLLTLCFDAQRNASVWGSVKIRAHFLLFNHLIFGKYDYKKMQKIAAPEVAMILYLMAKKAKELIRSIYTKRHTWLLI